MSAPDDLLDRLFAVPPDGFVAARDDLVRSLRESGDREAAAEIKALRRPTAIAWALNQLSRRQAEDVAALLERGEALRLAQRRAMSGVKDSGFREATERRRDAVQALTRKAAAILDELGGGQRAEPRLAAALEAATTDEAVAEELSRGRFVKEPSGGGGFEAVGGLGLVEGETPGEDAAERAEKLRAKEIRAAEAEVERAATEVHRAETKLRTLEADLQNLERRVKEARAEVERRATTLGDAEERLGRAREGVEPS